MKKTFCNSLKKIFLIISCALWAGMVQAQEITAIDFNGNLLGKVIPDGKVISFDNKILGSVTADSLILDTKNKIIGGIVPQGIAVGNDAKILGKVSGDGVVRNSSGQIVGKVLPSGLVVNDYFEILGQVIFPGLVYDDEGKISGRITGDGAYSDLSGGQIGIVTPDGYAYRKVGKDYLLDGRLISSRMVVSNAGDFVGSVVPGGQVTDFNSEVIGYIKADEYVYDNKNTIIGRIVNTGYAFDENGEYIGLVSYNGTVVKESNVIGKVRADNRVVNNSGAVIGVTQPFSSVAVDMSGHYLGYLTPNGNISKDTSVIGRAGARGQVFDKEGNLKGQIVNTGPVYDYKGEHVGHAVSNGSVIMLNGTTIGYMVGDIAYNLSGEAIGAIFKNQIVYDNTGTAVGLSGINSKLSYKGGDVKISPLGYVFDSKGNVVGRALRQNSSFYSASGGIYAYLDLAGQAVKVNGKDADKVFGKGMVIGSQNKVVAQSIYAVAAVNSEGVSLGVPNQTNAVLNKSMKQVGKILPDGSVTSSGGVNYIPKMGQAYQEDITIKFNGDFLGYVTPEGEVVNNEGVKIGYLVERGLVSDNNGVIVGSVMNYTGIKNSKCELLGVISQQASVYNNRGVYIGKVLSDFTVIGESGVVIGDAVPQAPVVDFNGNIIGYPNYKGDVSDIKGGSLGCLGKQGRLYDSSGEWIGNTTKYDPVIGFDGKVVGFALFDGSIIDDKNSVSGYQQPDGNVNSNAGTPLGMIMQYKIAFNLNNEFMGYIDNQGKVLNSQHKGVGRVDFDGNIYSGREQIGYALNDFYVYGNNDLLLGFINPNGKVVDFNNQSLGSLDKGFVIKNNEVIARGSRDYNIRDKQKLVLGELQFDGSVIDKKGSEIGRIDNEGQVKNSSGEIIAQATPLQYYRKTLLKKAKNYIDYEKEGKPIFDDNGNLMGYVMPDGTVVNEKGEIIGKVNENGEIVDANGNVIGKVNPDGSVVLKKQKTGKLNEKGEIVDANGNVIGRVNENGEIIDANGNVIGKVNPDGSVVMLDEYVSGKVNENEDKTSDKAEDKGKVMLDENGNVIGYIMPDGTVVNENGEVIGKVNENGEIFDADGNLIGKVNADGSIVNENGEIIGRQSNIDTQSAVNQNIMNKLKRRWVKKGKIKDDVKEQGESKQYTERSSKDLILGKDNKYYQSLGIALNPDGEYLGEILENNEVVDDKGNIIGYRMPDGLIIDDDGNLIGTEDTAGVDLQELNDKQEDKKDMFVPVGTFGPGGAYGTGTGPAGNLGPGGGYGPGERYDPTRQAALNAAMKERRENISVGKISSGVRKEAFDGYQKDWSEQGIGKSIVSWRVDMSEMIFSDKPIPAVIARAIDTAHPAPVTAYVERNVYAEEGRNIIIPAGSRLIGSFGSISGPQEATSDSARVQISWERLIRPDGSMFVFNGETADAQGRIGALGYVDQQLLKKYTLPALTTILSSSVAYMIASTEENNGSTETSKQQAASDARQNFLNDMQSLFNEILADKTNVKAMTYVPNGTRIIIYPKVDLWLRNFERDKEEEENRLKDNSKGLIGRDVTQTSANVQPGEDTYGPGGPTSTLKGDVAGDVVYNPDKVNVQSSGGSNSLIGSSGKKTAPPPPSYGSGVGVPPPPSSTSTTSSSSDDSVPSLF